MIKPDPKKWARIIFDPYEERLLKRNFGSFYLTGNVPDISSDRSLIITPNHFSWWDGFFIDYAVKKLIRKNFHLLMLEEQLKKYIFFRKLGAFSIEPGSARGIKESLNYCEKLLSDNTNLLVYYPQGSIQAYDKYPLNIKPGLFQLIRKENSSNILPAAFRIEYGNQKKPDIYLRFGSIIDNDQITRESEYFSNCFNENIRILNKEYSGDINKVDLFIKG